MLNFLRKKKVMKRILWGLAIIIIPAFVLWGSGSMSKRNLPFRHIGVIDGKKVTVDEFINSAKDVQVSIILNYFNQPDALEKIQKDRPLMNKLTWENILLKRSAEKNRIKVSDGEVISFITRHPLFAREGVFDNKLYNYILKNSFNMTPRAFEESVRDFLFNTKYKASIIKSVGVSDEELLGLYKNEFEKAKLYYLLIDKDLFNDKIAVSDKEITAFYDDNKESFRAPEKVIVQYIAFPHEESGEKEKALSELKRSFEILKSKPRDMEKLASDLGLMVKETAPFSREEIVPEVGALKDVTILSFRMRPRADILPVISENETGTSYIIGVKEKIPPRIKTKDEVSGYIASLLKDKNALGLTKEEIDRIREDAQKNKLSIKEIAKKYDLQLKETGFITRFDYIEGIGEAYKVVDIAFKTGPGKISSPVETRKGFVIVEPVEFEFIDQNKFEKDKDSYKNKIISLKKMKALQDWFSRAGSNSSLNVDLDEI